jgi:hydroxymethylbilane synthase
MAAQAVASGENVPVNSDDSSSKATFNVGSRKSKLALVQAEIVLNALAATCPENSYAIKARDTAAGDVDKLTPFKDMPVKNLWTHELETLMVEGQLDFLVHSLKGLSRNHGIGPVVLG